ncbi:MAG: SRPBCC family protein [Actinomycetes bacterium]
MARITETLEVELPADEVFDLVADFSNTGTWDPGIRSARRLDPEAAALGLGSRFELLADLKVVTPPLVYEVTTFERPRRVVLETSSLLVRGEDDVTVEPISDTRSRVVWRAEFALRGPGVLLDPLLAPGFRWVGAQAVQGLTEWLQGKARERAA